VAELVHLAGDRTSILVDVSTGVPTILHWGAPLGPDTDLEPLALALARAHPPAMLDEEAPLTVVPEHGSGFLGRPGLTGCRDDGSAWAPRFRAHSCAGTTRGVDCRTVDDVAGLSLEISLCLEEASDVLRARATITNDADTEFELDRLSLTFPLPGEAEELLLLTGRWAGEFRSRRVRWDTGAVVAENRRGRTSADHVPAVFAGTAGFDENAGEVWAMHIAWSGNHEVFAERLSDGRRYAQLGELLLPGEVRLAPGESYTTPWIFAAYGAGGLNEVSRRFHAHLRSRPRHPTRPRPVLLNTWEAVYFDHDQNRLFALAEAAAAAGVERFVLDDGWFRGRVHDRAGLGDWYVDEARYPAGLTLLIDHVRSFGMEFGLWVEPEMVNPDSDLHRAHPDWVLADPGYEPVLARHQLVLDLARPEAFEYILGRLDALLTENAISYLKWDMNRDLVHATHQGRAGAHAQTLAVYSLLDALNTRHPDVEIESCSSGGARADFEILERTCRVWLSDSNDALDRQAIQRGFSLLFPPEVMGAHIGPPRTHVTGRHHSLAFRAVSAMFGHLGVEWNVLDASPDDRAQLAQVIALHKRFRPLLHGGDVVRLDHPEPTALAHGVVATDRSEALFAFVQLASPLTAAPSPLRLAGLDADRRYAVEHVALPGEAFGRARRQPPWLEKRHVVLSGRRLAAAGIQLPVLNPESAILLHLREVG
jgi:alpha-galactosidase